jgi:hypothetical protein
MKTGTKSLLFGVHQFIWHPITVYIAWIWINKSLPNWKETVCIIIHDWGYWGKDNMDDEEGEKHPEWAANWARKHLDIHIKNWFYPKQNEYYELCLFHSRHLARYYNAKPSRLCWPDKLSIIFEPWWLYLPRAWATGELYEYREQAKAFIPLSASHREWFKWVKNRLATLGIEKRGDVVPYVNKIHD